MDLATQSSMIIVSTSAPRPTNTPCLISAINSLSGLSDTIQNLLWLVAAITAAYILLAALLSVRRKTVKYTRTKIDQLIKNGKYIPKIFVELNNSKEVLRYFIYGRKWAYRLIKRFNYVYDNSYGEILRQACCDPSVSFHLRRTDTLEKIEKTVKSASSLHNRFKESEEKLKQDYSQAQYLFEIMCYHYIDTLEELKQYIKAANSKYIVLTGSAGNGKTNLLCCLSELLIKLKESVVFLNSREIQGDLLGFMSNELKLPEIYKKHMGLYLRLVNLLLTTQRKHLFIIIDAVNENEEDGYGSRVAAFCNVLLKYSRVKVIASCRNEYYHERFRGYIVSKTDTPAFEFDLKEQKYTPAAIRRIFREYSKHFKYTGTVSLAVQRVLSEQLLLLRIFFEVNKGSDIDALSVRKHEIFAQYIEMAKKNGGEYIEKMLDGLADAMLRNDKFDEISLLELERSGISPNMVSVTMDSSILVSKKLVFHDGTIAKIESEVVYFVFDEMRDYYLARRIVLKHLAVRSVNGDAVIAELKRLKEAGASCAEGIIHYAYVFFRTVTTVLESDESEKLCNAILEFYRIPEGRGIQPYWHTHHREEFQNLGLRMILTSGLDMTDLEISYIRDCLRKDPGEDGGAFFDYMLSGTLNDGVYNIDTYLEIVLGLKDEDAVLDALKKIVARNTIDKMYLPADFIKYHKKLVDTEPVKALQIQKIAELFLCCLELKDKDEQERLIKYFCHLPTHGEVRREMIKRMRKACVRRQNL